jgi:flavin reductase (DIM6/NTAB) family NADH-FMN oxidoreductase RutF
MLIDHHAISAMQTRRRAAFVNSLSGFKSANLVGTVSQSGKTNLAIMSSALHLGSHPPLLALVIRPGGEDRHTLSNILDTGCFTLNHVNDSIIEASHQTAARYPRTISEFDATGLTPQWHPDLQAPMVAEAAVKLGLRLREHQELKINKTHFLIGEIVLADVPEAQITPDGALDLEGSGSIALSGLDTYHQCVTIKRMAYAKPDQSPIAID